MELHSVQGFYKRGLYGEWCMSQTKNNSAKAQRGKKLGGRGTAETAGSPKLWPMGGLQEY